MYHPVTVNLRPWLKAQLGDIYKMTMFYGLGGQPWAVGDWRVRVGTGTSYFAGRDVSEHCKGRLGPSWRVTRADSRAGGSSRHSNDCRTLTVAS